MEIKNNTTYRVTSISYPHGILSQTPPNSPTQPVYEIYNQMNCTQTTSMSPNFNILIKVYSMNFSHTML